MRNREPVSYNIVRACPRTLAPKSAEKLDISNDPSFADRLKTAAAAKKTRLEKFQPKATIVDPAFDSRKAQQALELENVRTERADQRKTALQARADAIRAAAALVAKTEHEALEAKRLDRKVRKTARRQDRRDTLSVYTRRAE
ncbi:DUF6481 family protein [Caulobacter sp. S45]|jgi:hypothetical protein|uniref:DUF6481 family protein n=1 Tax=Caulobacter sp. S45 TaxID=1641861 RepID=UPI00131B9C54|nr:DUF6481 family protein [Caulobacter sp. S45]